MLTPKRVKWRKQHRGRMRGRALVGNTLTFGEYGLQALEPVWMSNRQIEAARIAMTRHIKRGGKVWIKVFPDKSVTKKPAEVRMGSGKGNPEGWVAVVRLETHRLAHDLLVDRMWDARLRNDDDRLVHLVALDAALLDATAPALLDGWRVRLFHVKLLHVAWRRRAAFR